ncbi:MAG: hypothetical protein OEN23_00955 [Paracoccaceae bacterium]|nr:hypothetical protein [Paracoccaceae bacterium]
MALEIISAEAAAVLAKVDLGAPICKRKIFFTRLCVSNELFFVPFDPPLHLSVKRFRSAFFWHIREAARTAAIRINSEIRDFAQTAGLSEQSWHS